MLTFLLSWFATSVLIAALWSYVSIRTRRFEPQEASDVDLHGASAKVMERAAG
jgi:hypothetical protein